MTDRVFRGNWALVLQKIYEVDPLVCPKCADQMRVIAFIEEMDVIRKILKHLEFWDDRRRPVPTANSPRAAALQAAYSLTMRLQAIDRRYWT